MLCKTEYLSCASFLKVDTHVDCRRHSYVYVLKFAGGQLKKNNNNHPAINLTSGKTKLKVTKLLHCKYLSPSPHPIHTHHLFSQFVLFCLN